MMATPSKTFPHIVVFDSGVGGLGILREIRRQHPHCRLSYVCDNAAFPYGKKSAAALIDRVDKVLYRLPMMATVDIIVIACNSASTLALPCIRNRFQQPVVGVVPAIKPATIISQTQVIGLLATLGTVKRRYTKALIDEFAGHCQVISVGSSELVQLAEAKFRKLSVCPRTIAKIVQPFAENRQLDTLVLACTHFPLLLPELRAALPEVQHWVDSTAAIVRRVGYWLQQQHLYREAYPAHTSPQHSSYFTADDIGLDTLRPRLIEWQLGKVHLLKV